MFDVDEDPELHAAQVHLAERRQVLIDVLRHLLGHQRDLRRRLPGLASAELIELAEVLLLAQGGALQTAVLHRAVENLLEAQERSDRIRCERDARATDLRYTQRLRRTLEALSEGHPSAWLEHVDDMARDAARPR